MLQIVQEGFRKVDGRLDEIYEYLFRYYVEHDDQKALEEHRRKKLLLKLLEGFKA